MKDGVRREMRTCHFELDLRHRFN